MESTLAGSPAAEADRAGARDALAWEGRRSVLYDRADQRAADFDKGYIELDQMKGSWAGAMGQTQFMPSSCWRTRRITTATAGATSGHCRRFASGVAVL
jgi:membrane-bound lytic murein transglycosylase B